MQELLKEYHLVVIISLSALSLILLVVILVDQLYTKKRLYKKIKEQKEKLHEYNEWFQQTTKQKVDTEKVQQTEISQSLGNKTNIQGTLSNRIQTGGTSSVTLTNNRVDSLNLIVATTQPQKPQTHTYHYLQEANRGRFMKLLPSSDKSFFRTWEDDGGRKFEFCGNVEKALANINAIFDDVCDIEGKRSGATVIENISAGTLDPELRIITKAKIRLK